MDEPTPLTELVEQLRSKTAGNERVITILVQDATDFRVKRIIELLNEVALAAEAICATIEQIPQVSQYSSTVHRGFNPHLLLLHQELTDAANHHSELSKRILLYLQHLVIQAPHFSRDILHPIISVIAEQQHLADDLRFEGSQLLSTTISRPPGPSSSTSNAPQSTALSQDGQVRPLFDNKPLPVDDQYDARWDPDCKVPGSQYSKFLRFPGSFFNPEDEDESTCDNFQLPESAGLIIDSWLSKYEAVKTNFKETQRLPRRTKQSVVDEFICNQKSVNLILARSSGLPYDPDSINLFTPIRPRDTTSATGPYLSSAQRVKMNKLGTGMWEFEDLNRVLETQTKRSRDFVATMESGRQVYFDRSLNRNVNEN